MTFKKINIIEPILKALEEEKYSVPTPIQQQAIPVILKGNDIMGCAQTGTGKTAAFAIPILQQLANRPAKQPNVIRTLILTPTRELAIQISDNFTCYGRYLQLKHTLIFGGVSQFHQVKALRKGSDILIATPGRLLDLMSQKEIDLSNLEIFVLDEADRMLDMGFVYDVKKIVASLPAKRQTLLFSATMPDSIKKLAGKILSNPEYVSVDPVSSTAQSVTQSVYFVEKQDKEKLLANILDDASISRSLVFTRTKHGANKLVEKLSRKGISAAAIHGNKSQNARQKALADFKLNSLRVLVATDIASRGIDIDELPHVVNFDLPEVPETYVHRIGRTGRGGKSGTAITFCSTDEKSDLKNIEKLIGVSLTVSEVE
ncbi:DEAD/DEAH box helicase [Flavobacterium amniphilum]|uniref:DEAD/DEAH box helicase n=1 Tax=Flavobacterium amniphilum TaxID=1834035 RepID=UPI00202A82C5|nr:DEAD/DEAH box helicase [Flavobacterium amniphilum]MCL9804428.1 DEAD/DEAH box helicase [Flavobacterium amniphilum]